MYTCRYPVRVQDAVPEVPRSIAEAMVEEMKKAKPRDVVLLPLMKSTFQERRIFIQNEAGTVSEIIQAYPTLSRPAVVSFIMAGYTYFKHCCGFNPFFPGLLIQGYIHMYVHIHSISRLNRKWH